MGNKNSVELPIIEYTLDELDIKPFDLICFRGNDFVSNIISNVENKTFGSGEWTHVGIVMTKDVFKFKGNKKKLYIYESTMSGKIGDGVNNIYNQAQFGVQMRELDKVVESYLKVKGTKIGWCRLINNPYLQGEDSDQKYYMRLTKIKRIIRTFYYKNKNTKYDYTLKTFLKTLFPKLTKIKLLNKWLHTEDKYFCSELVARIYKDIGILDKKIDPENVAPVELLGYSNDGIGRIVEEPKLICRKKKYKKL